MMRILPKDLGLKWHVRFVQARDSAEKAGAEPPTPRLGFFGRLWTRGRGLDERSAAAIVPAASSAICRGIAMMAGPSAGFLMMSSGILFGALHLPVELLPAYLAAGVLGFGSVSVGITRSGFRKLLETPITAAEVDRQLERTHDAMDCRFLELVRDAVRQPGTEAEENVRAALGALAEAMERLPPIETPPLDTAMLREEAGRLQQQAQRETDRVTAESMQRRARAMLYRAQTHEHSALTVQRNDALRCEIEAQVAAMREGLVALQTQSLDAAGFGALAASALEVATEAVRMADAREELDRAVKLWQPIAPGSAAPEAQQVQTVRAASGGMPSEQ